MKTEQRVAWSHSQGIEAVPYTCGHCNRQVSSDLGLNNISSSARIRICPNCDRATYIDNDMQVPGAVFGADVDHIDEKNVHDLYNEARRAFSVNSFTATVLCCRKILMNVAVAKGAKERLNFVDYVDFLADHHYVPPNGKEWVDYIRELGNQATHEIRLMARNDAERLITFTEHLLRHIFEFPGRMREVRTVPLDSSSGPPGGR